MTNDDTGQSEEFDPEFEAKFLEALNEDDDAAVARIKATLATALEKAQAITANGYTPETVAAGLKVMMDAIDNLVGPEVEEIPYEEDV